MIFLVKSCRQTNLILISRDMLKMFYFSVKNNVLISIVLRGFNSSLKKFR